MSDTYVFEDAFGRKRWEIWSEGYVVTGQSAKASKLGDGWGPTFQDACRDLAKRLGWASADFNASTPSYWGCRLFDNESDARKAFG